MKVYAGLLALALGLVAALWTARESAFIDSKGYLRSESFLKPKGIYCLEDTYKPADGKSPSIYKIRTRDEPEGSGLFYQLSVVPPPVFIVQTQKDGSVLLGAIPNAQE